MFLYLTFKKEVSCFPFLIGAWKAYIWFLFSKMSGKVQKGKEETRKLKKISLRSLGCLELESNRFV